jgi:cyclic pyranopterin phosphate synthase
MLRQNPAMSDRVIPLVDERRSARPVVPPARLVPATGLLTDTLHRPLRDLRISVTDRCNFRCSYCMPKEVFDKDHAYLPHASLLSFEEITRLAAIFLTHGVRKIRLTGGEPLLRKNIEVLVGQLAGLRTVDGDAPDITLTTNGSLLARKAQALKDAGLQRVTVSLDGLDDTVFRRMNDVDFPVAEVLEGIDAAHAAGLGPVKVNMVVKRGTNEHEILPMARHFRGTGVRCCASSSTWTWAPPTAGAWTKSCRPPTWSGVSTPSGRWWRWRQRPAAKLHNAGVMPMRLAAMTRPWARSA